MALFIYLIALFPSEVFWENTVYDIHINGHLQ